jgi:hypothetical protein
MKTILKNYTFNTATKAITLTDIATVRLDRLALITDVTTNKILYNFADSTIATATVSTNVVTLSALQGGENNTDKLRIDYDVELGDTGFGDSTDATNITKLAGTTIDTNSGSKSAGTQRVILATDQPQLTNALKVDGSAVTQPVSISGNQAVNVAQMNGVTTSMGNGTTDTGTQRVSISSDSTGLVFAKLKDASGNNTSVQTMGDTMAAAPTTTLGTAAFNAIYNGTNFVRQPGTTSGAYNILRDAAGNARGANVNASNQLSVSVDNTVTVASHAVTNAGTFAVQATAVGTVADDATTPGNPVMIGGKAVETDGTDPSSVSAEDDVAIARTDRNRRLLVNTYHPNLWTANDNQSTAQTNTSLKTAPGAGLSLYITDVIVSNGATAGDVRIVEDPAGTPVIKVPKIYVAINGGAVLNFSTPIRITANKAVGYTSTTVTTHSVQINGYTAP